MSAPNFTRPEANERLPTARATALGNTMASDDKKTKTSPAPKNETAVKKEAAAKNKDEGQPKNRIASDADLSKAEGSEKAADSPLDRKSVPLDQISRETV
jgi:hypothetical protein